MLANVFSNVWESEQVEDMEQTFENVSCLPQELTEIPAISILSRLEDTVGVEAFSDVEGDEANDMDDVDSDVTRVVSLNVQIVLENLKVKTDDQEDVHRVSGNSTRTEVELNEDYGPEISETDIMSTISDIQNEGNEAFEIHF